MEREKAASYTSIKDLRSVSFQKLGCYFMFRQLSQLDQAVILKMYKDQSAVFNLMIEAFEKEYQQCLDKEATDGSQPDLEYLIAWQKKMRDCYEYNTAYLENYIENVSKSTKKKQKKKYQKLKLEKQDQGMLGTDIDPLATLSSRP